MLTRTLLAGALLALLALAGCSTAEQPQPQAAVDDSGQAPSEQNEPELAASSNWSDVLNKSLLFVSSPGPDGYVDVISFTDDKVAGFNASYVSPFDGAALAAKTESAVADRPERETDRPTTHDQNTIGRWQRHNGNPH